MESIIIKKIEMMLELPLRERQKSVFPRLIKRRKAR